MSSLPVFRDKGLILIKTYWMGDEELQELINFCASFITYNDIYKNNPRMSFFRNQKSICFIYTSNRLEDTLPKNFSQRYSYEIIKILFESAQSVNEIKVPWNADGITKEESLLRQQMVQHVKALKYMCEDLTSSGDRLYQRDLTIDNIKEAHRILMRDAVDADNKPILAGEFRNFSVHAGDYTYQPYEEVPVAVEATVDKFNKTRKNGSLIHPIKLVADLFYDMITIHPFGDGNGRLCRLLVAYAFYSIGVPFPVSITTGHSRSRRHYMDSILKARRIGNDRSYLYTLMCTSLFLGWSNFMNHVDDAMSPTI